jgi:hypothetical protein
VVFFYYELAWQGGRFRVGPEGVLGLGLIVVYCYCYFLCKVGGFGFVYKGVLWLMLGHLYSDFVFQGRRLRVVYPGVLGLGLMLVYFHHEFALQGRRFKVAHQGLFGQGLMLVCCYYVLFCKVGGLGLSTREYQV